MNLLGPHIQIPGNGLDLLGRWKPAAVTLMDVNGAFIRQVRERSPEMVICTRKYEHGLDFTKANPEEWADAIWSDVKECPPDYAYTINEPFGHDNRYLFAPFDDWQVRVGRRLRAHGIEPLINCFGTGNFTCDGPSIVETLPYSCEEFDTHGPHDYSWPNLWDGVYYYALRWLTWYSDIKEYVGKEARFLIGECGLTQAVIAGRPDHGWRSGGPEGVTDASYLDSLRWYNNMLCQFDKGRGIVLGATIFNFYDQYHQSFEHIGKDDVINTIIAMDSPVIPEEPNGGNMDIKIYDYDGNLRDWDWLRAEFGDVQVHPVEKKFPIRQGEHIYKVCYLRAKSGYAAILINTKDQNGQNRVGEAVVFGWSSADPHGLTDTGHNWTGNGVVGHTNETGDVGPGMGTGSYYSPADGERGPHWCWVYGLPSDYVDGLGMLAMTNHNHVDVGYCEVIAGDVEPPEPPTDGDLLAAVLRLDENVAEILSFLLKTPPEPPPPADTLFRGEYFNNTTLSGAPALTRDDEKIDFNWGEESPDPKVNANDFSVRWTGKKTFEARAYTFHALTDDGFRLWVDGQLLIDAWKLQSPTPYQATKTMAAGQHDIKVEYFERGGGAVCKLWWE